MAGGTVPCGGQEGVLRKEICCAGRAGGTRGIFSAFFVPQGMVLWGCIIAPGARRASFFYHSPPVPVFAPPHQTIWRTFSPCLRIWPILCMQFMTMARNVVGSGGSDILCC